jgi:hypothetical protein
LPSTCRTVTGTRPLSVDTLISMFSSMRVLLWGLGYD